MHISSIGSPLTPSSLWDTISRCSEVVDDAIVYWRLLVAFLSSPDGDEQVCIIGHEEGDLYRAKSVKCATVKKQPTSPPEREAPTLSIDRRRLQKEAKAAEKRAQGEARAAAEAAAVAEADAVLERQSARPDATSAMLTRVLAKREGAASPDVVARARTQRDSLRAAERAARRPAKARPERGSAERVRREGAEPMADARLAAALHATLVLQQHARAWLRCRRKARRKRRSRAAKSIQRAVRAWLLPQKGISSPFGARVTGVGECKAEPARSDPAGPPPRAVEEGGDASCVVCLERPRAVVLLPCRHLSMCALCAAGVSTCPICRSAVEESMVVFV